MDISAGVDRAGTAAGHAGPLDQSALAVGGWLNTHRGLASLVRIDLRRVDGQLTARLFWMGDPVPAPSDTVPIKDVYVDAGDARKAVAFATRHWFGPVRCDLQVNMTFGLMVAAAFVRFPQGSSRTDYFTRAFLYHSGFDVEAHSISEAERTASVVHQYYPPADVKQLTGTWTNTNHASTGVVQYVVGARGRHVTCRAIEAGHPASGDWGEAAGHVYGKGNEAQEPMIFTASFDTADREIGIQAKLNQGLLVVAHFYKYKGGDRPDSYARELYYKA